MSKSAIACKRCNKRRYISYQSALDVAKGRPIPLEVYPCKYGGFHLTSHYKDKWYIHVIRPNANYNKPGYRKDIVNKFRGNLKRYPEARQG